MSESASLVRGRRAFLLSMRFFRHRFDTIAEAARGVARGRRLLRRKRLLLSFNESAMRRVVLLLSLYVTSSQLHAQDAPLPPRVAAMKMTLPDGFKATLFA